MPSVTTCCRRILILLILLTLTGCAKKLPEPQVIHNPPRITPTVTASFTATQPPELTNTPVPSPTCTPIPNILSYEVEPLSQTGLLLDGASTGVGCVPVCIEMMTSWWHSIFPSCPILTAQETIDRNASQGLYIAGRGMTSASAADELAELGYVHQMKLNSSKEELWTAFEAHGPIGLLVKTNWVPTTMNHAVVLTAWDADSDRLTFNDPFWGYPVTWTWEEFDGIWGLNYSGDRDYSGNEVRRVFFAIYPENTAHSAKELLLSSQGAENSALLMP